MATESLPTISERLKATTTAQRVGLAVFAAILIAFFVVFFAYEKQIFQLLEPAVDFIRKSSAGMVVLGAIMAATCIFPLFGYGVVSMICGYVYGIPKGFIPAFLGDVIGASAGFWLYRLVFSNYISRKFGNNIEFRELSKAISKDGIFLLFLIRLSSFPFAVLNAYFGAMTQLPFWKFILATTLSTPRLFLSIFLGQNISSLSDPTVSGKNRTLKWVVNIVGLIIALAAGWYVYRLTNRRIARVNAGMDADEDGNMDMDIEETSRLTGNSQYNSVINMEDMESHDTSSSLHTASTLTLHDIRGHKSEIL